MKRQAEACANLPKDYGALIARCGLSALREHLAKRSASFSTTQRVSVARALRPLVKLEGKRRQASTGTAPGRGRASANEPGLNTAHFLAGCLGMGLRTLRLAEQAVAIAERLDRETMRRRLQQLDHFPVAEVHDWLTSTAPAHAYMHLTPNETEPTIGTEFGERVLAAALDACTAKRSSVRVTEPETIKKVTK